MKKSSTCSSCGMKGHWKGDPECPNVKSGKDPLHKKTNAVHFTFMVNTEAQCSQCLHFSPSTAKFCAECGAIMRDHPMPSETRKRIPSEDEERWDLIQEHSRPFSYEVTREVAQVAAKMKAKAHAPTPASTSTAGKVRLHGQEVLAALSNMSRQEKKELHRALQEEEQKEAQEAWERRHHLMPEVGQGGYTGEGFEDPFAHSNADPGRGSQEVLAPPEGKDKPKPVKEKELKDFRKSLYDAQVQGGRVVPSSAAPPPNEAQARCTHPFDGLRWSANAEGHYARCKRCDLKHVVYYSMRHGVMMVTMPHEAPEGLPKEAKVWIREDKGAKHYKMINPGGPAWEQVCCRVTKDVRGEILQSRMITHEVEEDTQLKETIPGPPRDIVTEFWYVPDSRSSIYNEAAQFIQSQKPGLAIADSGCRNAVGGVHWHRHYQKVLDQLGIPWEVISEREIYKFGAGAPIVSKEACLYPVMIHGKMDIIRMSIVQGGGEACPGLIGPGELSRWKAVFRFADKQLELNGRSKPMQLTVTRHPGINLLEGGKHEAEELRKFWQSKEGEEQKAILTTTPHKYAFLTGTGEDHEKQEDAESEETEEEEEASDGDRRDEKT